MLARDAALFLLTAFLESAVKRANGTGTVYKMAGKRAKPWAAQKNGVWIGAYPTKEEASRALERLADREITDELIDLLPDL